MPSAATKITQTIQIIYAKTGSKPRNTEEGGKNKREGGGGGEKEEHFMLKRFLLSSKSSSSLQGFFPTFAKLSGEKIGRTEGARQRTPSWRDHGTSRASSRASCASSCNAVASCVRARIAAERCALPRRVVSLDVTASLAGAFTAASIKYLKEDRSKKREIKCIKKGKMGTRKSLVRKHSNYDVAFFRFY